MALHLQGFRGVRFNFVKHLGGEYTARLTDLDGDVQHPVVPRRYQHRHGAASHAYRAVDRAHLLGQKARASRDAERSVGLRVRAIV